MWARCWRELRRRPHNDVSVGPVCDRRRSHIGPTLTGWAGTHTSRELRRELDGHDDAECHERPPGEDDGAAVTGVRESVAPAGDENGEDGLRADEHEVEHRDERDRGRRTRAPRGHRQRPEEREPTDPGVRADEVQRDGAAHLVTTRAAWGVGAERQAFRTGLPHRLHADRGHRDTADDTEPGQPRRRHPAQRKQRHAHDDGVAEQRHTGHGETPAQPATQRRGDDEHEQGPGADAGGQPEAERRHHG